MGQMFNWNATTATGPLQVPKNPRGSMVMLDMLRPQSPTRTRTTFEQRVQGDYRPSIPGRSADCAPVKFANACAGCHLLTFDKRFDEGVPHDKPHIVHAFLLRKFSAYIAAHPSELHEIADPARDLTGKPLPPRMRTLTPSQWID